ncbi:MAG: hypothetical protein EXR28_02110 [Betaproteobacteria bacterium]|nr:hypothetical protein [Betaproteobacteria bacterium]
MAMRLLAAVLTFSIFLIGCAPAPTGAPKARLFISRRTANLSADLLVACRGRNHCKVEVSLTPGKL